MKKNTGLTPIMLAIAALLSACASSPTNTPLLEQARSAYQDAQNNPNVSQYAPLELKQAGDAMEMASAASTKGESQEKIDKLAYIAKQKIAISQEAAKQKASETDIAHAGTQMSEVQLAQRTVEADKAKQTTQDALARTTQLEAQLTALAAKKTARGDIVTLGDMLFATDHATLSPKGVETVQKLAEILQQNPERTVRIEGFTDSTGGGAYNRALSMRRASSVKAALLGMGVDAERMVTHGYGAAYPTASNRTAQNRQLNRRVEVLLSDEHGHTQPR
ncbi:OmpA family protein [Paludibacterium yongneupense]|uniref:OmpA family protein n=1 Tax=Paludibacterium yongneupense TaxID=400061 RepID=UPI000424A2FB|nr:OmpA family protein [Paludibacterium yongneupense]